jgi:hypothetical protein
MNLELVHLKLEPAVIGEILHIALDKIPGQGERFGRSNG